MAERTRRGKASTRTRGGSDKTESRTKKAPERKRPEKKKAPRKQAEKRTTKDLYDEDYEHRDAGFKVSRVLDMTEYDDVKWYTVKEGKNEIDIIPYEVKSDKHPKGRPVGELDYKLLVAVHRFVGDGKDSVVCLRETYGEPCPICEERQRMIDSDEYTYKDDEVRNLKPSERVFYNVIDLLGDSDEVMLFESSNFEFQKELIEEAEQGRDADGEIIPFAELLGGYSVKFRGSEREGEFKSSKSYKPKSFKFIERDDYDESILDEVFPIDEMLIRPTYDEVKKIADGMYFSDDDDEDEKPKKSRRHNRDEDEDEEPRGKSKRRRSRDDEDEKPSRRKSRRKSKDDEDEDFGCPGGGVFGEDTDALDACEDCAIWKACSKAYEEK